MRVAFERKISKILETLPGPFRAQLTFRDEAAEDLGNLYIQEIRSMKG